MEQGKSDTGRTAAFGKYALRALGALMAVVLLLVLAVQLPPVQTWLGKKATEMISRKLGAPVTLDRVQLRLLDGSVALKGFFMADQQGDTLLYFQRLGTGVKLRPLLSRSMIFDHLTLFRAVGNVHPVQDTVMNYQFVIDAFSSEPAEPDTSASAWTIGVADAAVDLEDIRLNAAMPDSALALNLDLGTFRAYIRTADLTSQQFDLSRLALQNTDMDLWMAPSGPEQETEETTTSSPLSVDLGVLEIENIGYAMHLPGLALRTAVPGSALTGLSLAMEGDSMGFDFSSFSLEDGAFQYDLTDSVRLERGFDPNHLDLDHLHIALGATRYADLDIASEVRRVSGHEAGGFTLANLRGQVAYSPEEAGLRSLVASTANSSLELPRARIAFPDTLHGESMNDLEIQLDLEEARIGPADIAYFVPDLAEEGWIDPGDAEPFTLEADLDGRLADLLINRVALSGWGVRTALNGRVGNLGAPESLWMDMAVNPLEVEILPLLQHLPDSLIPQDLDLPERLWAEARATGDTDSLGLMMTMQTSRPEAPVSGRLQLEGYAREWMQPEKLTYFAQIDTLLVMREELAAHLGAPDSTDTSLPQALALRAELGGSLDSVHAEYLDLREERDSAGIALLTRGEVTFPDGAPIGFDLMLDTLVAPGSSLSAYLPDSTLPAGVVLPDLFRGEGFLTGTTEDLEAGLELDTRGARLSARAQLADSVYRAHLGVDSFRLAHWLDTARYDTLVGIDLVPLGLTIDLEGEGLSLDDSLRAGLVGHLQVQDSAYAWRHGLVFTGAAKNRTVDLTAQIEEDGVEGQLSAEAVLDGDTATVARLDLHLRQIDMQTLRLSSVPLNVGGSVELESKGLNLENLEAEANLRGIQFVYDTVRVRLDSLLLEAELKERQVHANLDSDLAYGQLDGQFDVDKIAGTLRNSVLSYFVPALKQDSLAGQPGDSLVTEIRIRDPALLTSGIIPGLTAVDSSSGFTLRYERDADAMIAGAVIPHIAYKTFSADSLVVSFLNDSTRLLYAIQFDHLTGPADFESHNFLIGGQATGEGATKNILSQTNVYGKQRFRLQADLERGPNRTVIKFQPNLLLDYETWTIPEDNQLVIDSAGFHFTDWRLERQDQSLSLKDGRGGKDVRATFDGFDLLLLGNTLRDSSQLVSGRVDGFVEVANVLDQPRLRTDIEVDTLKIVRAPLGNLQVAATQGDSADWEANLALVGDTTQLFVEGTYAPQSANPLEAQLRTNPLRLSPFKGFAMGQLKDLQGLLYADVSVGGALSAPRLEGQIRFADVVLTPTMVNTPFRLGENPITFTTSQQGEQAIYLVDFGTFTLTDANGQQAALSGGMRAEGFSRYGINMDVAADRFLVMNSTEKDNEEFYGTVRLNFDGKITGRLDSIDVNLEVEPTDESTFTYAIAIDDVAESEDWVDIITFEPPNAPDTSLAVLTGSRDSVRAEKKNFDLYFSVNASLNDDLELNVITNPVAGDYFQGKLEGNLSVTQSPRTDMRLAGSLTVLEGTYLFTYTEFVKREFDVRPSSTITWTGEMLNPEMDISAVYTSRASPSTLVAKYAGQEGAQAATQISGRQEFDVVFNIDGELEDFNINTDIEYPRNNFNQNISAVNDAISTLNQDESETNSQAFSLLLFNSFLATSGTGGGRLVNLQQGFSQIVTGYLNNFADQYINFVDLEFDLESRGDDLGEYFEETDFRVSLKKQFLDNRLEIRVDGVASNYDPDSDRAYANNTDREMQAYLDNITVEYSINPQGALKIRLFNERDTEDLWGGEVIKLGGALVFSKSFDSLRIFGPKEKRASPKNTAPESDN